MKLEIKPSSPRHVSTSARFFIEVTLEMFREVRAPVMNRTQSETRSIAPIDR